MAIVRVKVPDHVRIGLFVEADMGIADLQEQRQAGLGRRVGAARLGQGQVERGEYPGGEGKKGSRPPESQAFQGAAARRIEQIFVSHVGLLSAARVCCSYRGDCRSPRSIRPGGRFAISCRSRE